MGEDEKKVNETMWEGILGDIERRLNLWKLRMLSLKGKVLILNVLMVSKLWYVLYVSPLPLWIEKRLKIYIFMGRETSEDRTQHVNRSSRKSWFGVDWKNCLRVKIVKKNIWMMEIKPYGKKLWIIF